MRFELRALYLLIFMKFAKCGLDPFITGGKYTQYRHHPHSVYLIMKKEYDIVCGGSIINQDIILTAAHCMFEYDETEPTEVQVGYGHEKIHKMKMTYMKEFLQHDKFDIETLVNDICLLSLIDRMPLGTAKRVIIMKKPPKAKYGYVAGWGDNEFGEPQSKLKSTRAVIHKRKVCVDNYPSLQKGVFCAGPIEGIGAPDSGDSGSALIIEECIQIGIVSYQLYDSSLVGYTNVSYFFKWIKKNAKKLYCNS